MSIQTVIDPEDSGLRRGRQLRTGDLSLQRQGFSEEVVPGGRISSLPLTCALSGKPLSPHIPVCKMVRITRASRVCSLDAIHLGRRYTLRDGGETSGEERGHRGPFHPSPMGSCLSRPVCPHPLRSLCNLSQKGALAGSIVLGSSAPPWLQGPDL